MFELKCGKILIFVLQVGKDKTLRVKVVTIHPLEKPEGEGGEKKLEGACDSPSSDKENATQENQRKDHSLCEEEKRRESLSNYIFGFYRMIVLASVQCDPAPMLQVIHNEDVFTTLHFLSGDRARRSPRKLPTAMKEEKKKWAIPKFLPHKYDVKLISEDKVCIIFV